MGRRLTEYIFDLDIKTKVADLEGLSQSILEDEYFVYLDSEIMTLREQYISVFEVSGKIAVLFSCCLLMLLFTKLKLHKLIIYSDLTLDKKGTKSN